MLDVPGEVARRVAHRLARAAEPQQAAQLVRVPRLRRRAEHPRLELVVQGVAASLERADLGRQRAVVEQDRGVGEADRRLGEVLQLHQDVDGAVELGQRRRVVVVGFGPSRGARELAEQRHALLGPAHEQDVALREHVVGAGVELPLDPAADRHDPHARLGGERELAERAADHQRARADLDPGGHLVRVAEVAPERVGDPEPSLDDPCDVGGGVPDLLDRARDPQDAGHRLRVLGAAGGEHRHLAQAAQVAGHPLLETLDLAGELVLVEEHRGVREVDHELGGVLRLDEQVLHALRLVIHSGAPPMMS